MTEINSFPINTLTFEELDPITDAQATDADGVLFFDESVGVMKRMTRGELFKGKVIPINSIADFPTLDVSGFDNRQQFHLNSFAPDGSSGGGPLMWAPDKPKSLHDGIRYFSPTVPIPADFDNPTDVQNYMDGVGEEFPTADGIFELTLYSIESSEFPSIDGAFVLWDGVSGTRLKNGVVPSLIGIQALQIPNIAAVSYARFNADETISMRTLVEHKTDLLLNNVDNTSDANKPISTATQAALNLKANISDVNDSLALKAPLLSPAFTGNPTAPTPPTGDNDTSLATTAFVQGELSDRIQSVATIADLRLLEPTVDRQTVATIGHTQSGIGSNEYYYDAADVSSVDNGGTVVSTGSGKRYKLKLPPLIDITSFGAIGDGVTDCTAAIQAALSSAAVLGYGVLIPSGVFVTNSLTSTGCRYIGGYGQASVLKAVSGVTSRTLTLTTNEVTVEGIKFLGTGNADQTGIYNAGQFKCTVANCIFEDLLGTGGIWVQQTGTSQYGALDGMLIEGCSFYNCFHGIHVAASGEYVTIDDCVFQKGCGWAIWSAAGNTLINGCNIVKCQNGIYKSGVDTDNNPSNGNHSIISGCNINHIFTQTGPGAYSPGHALWFDTVTLGDIVTGCAIYDANITLINSIGVYITDCQLAVISYNFAGSTGVIENNWFYKAYGHNISNTYGGTVSFIQWINNRTFDSKHGLPIEEIRGAQVVGEIDGSQSVASGSGPATVNITAVVNTANNPGNPRFEWWDDVTQKARNLGYGGNRISVDVQFLVEYTSGGDIGSTIGYLNVGGRAYVMNRVDYAGNSAFYSFAGDVISTPGEEIYISLLNNSGQPATISASNGWFVLEGL